MPGGRRRRNRGIRPVVVCATTLTLALAVGCAGTATERDAAWPAGPDPITEAEALEVFDFAWARVYETYYDTTFGGLDWHEVGAELRPRAARAGRVSVLRGIIAAMLDHLGDSHFGVIPAEHADALDPEAVEGARGEPGTVGIELRVVDDELVVFRVAESSPARMAGVRPGWSLQRVDTTTAAGLLAVLDEVPHARPLAEARLAVAAEARLAGRVGDTVTVAFQDGARRVVARDLVSEPRTGMPVRFGNLPTMFTNLESQEVAIPQGCAGIIRFDVWMVPIMEEFERAFFQLHHCDGFILDLRGNPGGVAGMAMAVSGYFMTERQTLGVMRTREQELNIVSMPRRVTLAGQSMIPFQGPLALVVDGQSMSTTEIFTAGLQGLGRARVFGETTGGQALPALMVRMPNRDILMYAFADFVGPDGTRIEGRGAIPDTSVPLTREGLLAGQDRALSAAVDWIVDVARSRPTQEGQ